VVLVDESRWRRATGGGLVVSHSALRVSAGGAELTRCLGYKRNLRLRVESRVVIVVGG
jgi:hypothetical protein